jgi:flavin reductase (DIM6/NTAB) family NADH-FMN oxidoreductase RutF
MFFETGARDTQLMPRDPFKAIVAPRPIGWISTRARDGRINLAPYSFFNGFNSVPPIVGFSSEGYKDSADFAKDSGEFVANLVSFDLMQKMNLTSAPLPRGTSEFGHAGLTMAPCRLVKAPRVAEAHAALECKVVDHVPLKNRHGEAIDSYLTLGEVIAFHIDDALIREGRFDTAAARPVARCGYFDYTVVEALMAMTRPPGGEGRSGT